LILLQNPILKKKSLNVFLEYVSNSPALQKAVASSAPISAKAQTEENKTSSAIRGKASYKQVMMDGQE